MVGIVVLIVAVVALHDPRSDSTGSAGTSGAVRSGGSSGSSTAPSPSGRATSPAPTRSPAPSTTGGSVQLGGSGTTSSAGKSVPLIVLNNTTTPGLAKQAAARFESGGWTVSSSGNLTNNIVSTCAYYDPDVTGARAAARALQAQYPTIKRVEPRFAELPSGPVVVVLTPDYSSG